MNQKTIRGLVSLLAVAGLVGAACSSDSSNNPGGGVAGPNDFRSLAPEALPGAVSGAGGSESADAAVSGVAPLPELGARVIKTATVRVGVARGTFQEKFQEATLVAARH